MASKKSRVRTIRMRNKVADYFADKPLGDYVEWLWESIRLGEILIDANGVPFVERYGYNWRDFEKACTERGYEPYRVLQAVTLAIADDANYAEFREDLVRRVKRLNEDKIENPWLLKNKYGFKQSEEPYKEDT